jgi:hypothetical protein
MPAPFSWTLIGTPALPSSGAKPLAGVGTIRGLKLDGNGDLLRQNGAFVLVSGSEAIVQSVRVRLQFFLGEWFLDESVGVPYYEQILVKNPDLSVIRQIIRKVIVDTVGITELKTLELNLDRGARLLYVSFVAAADTGQLIQVSNIGVTL